MPVDAAFDVQLTMPGGTRSLVFVLQSRGTLLNGTVEGDFGKYPIRNGTLLRREVRWTINLKAGNSGSETSDDPGPAPAPARSIFRRAGRFLKDSLSGPAIGTTPFLRWKRPPRDMIVEFSGLLEGDCISGEMRYGTIATGSFRGAVKTE